MESGSRYDAHMSFLDMLWCTLFSYFILFILAILLITPQKKDETPKPKAEFVVIVEWDPNIPDDVDTWIENPAGDVVSFKNKENGLMHLDRDDVGAKNDFVVLPDGSTKHILLNQEITTIRGVIEGEFVVNIHMFSKNSPEQNKVKVTLIDVNPTWTIATTVEIILPENYEKTAFRFNVNKEGEIVSINQIPKRLAYAQYANDEVPSQ